MKTLQNWAKTAIDIQSACNLSGVVHSFSEFMTWLRQEYPTEGTEFYNTHFIAVLFSDKIVSLTRSCTGFSQAYEEAQREANKNEL
jgi:hypothetical protein